MNRDKIGTQTCYIHQCTKRYVDVHSMSVSQSCLCSFLCNPYIHFKFPKFFIYLLLLLLLLLFLKKRNSITIKSMKLNLCMWKCIITNWGIEV